MKKDYINYTALSEPKTGVLFSDFVNKIIERKAKRMSASYMNNYKTVLKHLDNFCTVNEAILYTNSINEELLDDFIIYLQSLKLSTNYINNLIGLVKAMSKKAATSGYSVDPSYDDIKLKNEETFSVYLSMNEITRIYYYPNLTKKQERIRDLFIIGCLTALRYSDYSTLTKENFQGDFIIKTVKKTNKEIVIPLHDYIKEILIKYNNEIPGGFSIQYFNRAIKSICKNIGINDRILDNKELSEKWEHITSHTARRSAATNMYLTGRLKTYEIMALTGHSSEKSFFRYIKVTKNDIAKQISTDTYFKK